MQQISLLRRVLFLFGLAALLGAGSLAHAQGLISVPVTQDGDLTVSAATNADTTGAIYLYDTDGTTQLGAVGVGYGSSGSVTIPHVGPGTYYAQFVVGGGPGGYSFHSFLAPATSTLDSEPNDTKEHALPTGVVPTSALSVRANGRLGYSRSSYNVTDDTDWYTCIVSEDGDLTLQVATDPTLTLAFYIYDQDGTTQLTGTGVGYSSSASVVVPHIGPGTYYVQIQRGGGYGGYQIQGYNAPTTLSDGEPDDTINQAHALGNVPNTAKGRLGWSRTPYSVTDDTDWYTITVPQDGDLTVTTSTSAGLTLGFYIYDVDKQTQLSGVGVGYGSSASFVVPHIGPGTYYVQIQRGGGYGYYTLTDSLKPTLLSDAEPNDTINQAIALGNVPNTAAGRLGWSRTPYSVTDDTDWYTITVPQDGDLQVKVSTSDGLTLAFYIYDVDGTTQLTGVGVGYNSLAIAPIPHIGPGTYYVQIQRGGGYGYYTLTDLLTPPNINDHEPNDTEAQAVNLPLNSSLSGRLGWSRTPYSTTDDTDWYKITVPQGGDLTVTTSTSENLTLAFYIYDVDGTTQLTGAGVGYGSSASFVVPHVEPGTYYVQIQRGGGYGYYTIANSLTSPSSNDNEPNDTPAQALPFPIDSSVQGTLGYSRASYSDVDREDWYYYSVPRDGNATFTLTTDSTLTASVAFYDADGVTQDGITGVGYGSTGALVVPHLAPGATYYVRLQLSGGYGGYTLSNGFAPLFVPNDTEVNDTAAQAIPLASLNNIPGHLGYSRASYSEQDNQDWYAVNLPAGSFSVSMSLTSTMTAYLTLYAPDGMTSLNSVGSTGGNVQLNYDIPAAGTYYFRVSRNDGYGAYYLNQPLTATVSGVITLDGIVPGALAQNITVEFRPANGTPFTRTVSVGNNGAYFITNVPRDKYTLAFQGAKWLRKVIQNVDVIIGDASSADVLLPSGDANNDNIVDIGDFGLLVNVYGDSYNPADPNANAGDVASDFNCDGIVDIGDFGLMVNNYGQKGDL